MVFAYRLTDNWDTPSPHFDCVPLVYGVNALAVGIPLSWSRVGAQWQVDCVVSAGAVSGVTAVDNNLISVQTAGSLPVLRDGVNLGTVSYSRTTIARILTTEHPLCCTPRFRVARGRVGPLLATSIQTGTTVYNVTQHTSGVAVGATSPVAIAPGDMWYATEGAGLIQTLPDILLDLAQSPEGLRYLSPENTFYDWGSLRAAKEWILTKGFNLAGQYWGRQSFVRLVTELAAQSGCLLVRRESGLGLVPETYGIPKALFTAANTNEITYHRNSWHRHLANRVSSENSRVRVVQESPGLADPRNFPAPSLFPAEWVDDEASILELQRLWIDSVRRQDLEVTFISTTLDAHKLGPGDLIQVISPNLEQTPGEVSGYATDGKPSWEANPNLPWVHQKDGQRVVGVPGQGTYPAARTGADVGVFRVTETRPIDTIRVAFRAVIRPGDLGTITLVRKS